MNNNEIYYRLRELKRKLTISLKEQLLRVGDEVETIGGNGVIVSINNGKAIVKLGKSSDFPGSEMEYDLKDINRI